GLGRAFGHRGVDSREELVARLDGKMGEYEHASGNFPPREVANGPVFENQNFGDDINLLQFPAPKWHEHDGGNYIGTGCVVMTKDPDSGRGNVGFYRGMGQGEKGVTGEISSGHPGAKNPQKNCYQEQPRPPAVNLSC